MLTSAKAKAAVRDGGQDRLIVDLVGDKMWATNTYWCYSAEGRAYKRGAQAPRVGGT